MHLVLFWPIVGSYPVDEKRDLGEIHFLRNTEIRLENTRNTKIRVHHHERRVQRFPGCRTLWDSGRPTLRNIASTSSAIWGKYTFYEIQKYGLKIQEIQKSGCIIANIMSRGFPGCRTLWDSVRPTLRNIASTSSAIWGEIHFLQNTEIRLENTGNAKIGVHLRERRVQRFSWV